MVIDNDLDRGRAKMPFGTGMDAVGTEGDRYALFAGDAA